MFPKLKGKSHVDSKDSIIKTHVNPSIPLEPSQLPSPKESLPNSPKPSLTISTTDSIKFFPEIYIELSLKDSTVVSQIHSFKYSPKISPKESLEDLPVWSTTPKFSFLDPKREVLEISQTSSSEIPLEEEEEEEELIKTYINPLSPENSQLYSNT
jgi:hypothetical protein